MANKKKKANQIKKVRYEARKKQEELKREKRNNIILISIAAFLSVAIIVGLTFALGGFDWLSSAKSQRFKVTHNATIEIENYGTVELELYGKEAPITVENFTTLANSGFYDGLTFHRIIEGFMAQGGQNPSVSVSAIKGEFKENGVDNNILHKRGVISMARTNDFNSATSQFFIMHQDAEHLDEAYAAFGKVTKGIEVIDKICTDANPYDDNGSILPANQPKITKITVTEK